jgi:hypothetical protein
MMNRSDAPSPFPDPAFVGVQWTGCVSTRQSSRTGQGYITGCPRTSLSLSDPTPSAHPKTSPFDHGGDPTRTTGDLGTRTTGDLGTRITGDLGPINNHPIPPMSTHNLTPVVPHPTPRVTVSPSTKGSNVPSAPANGSTYASTAKVNITQANAKSNPSPIRAHKLAIYLRDYDQALSAYLVDGFLYGFRIHCTFPPNSSVPSNHPSALQNRDIVNTKIAKEIQAGRIAGPYLRPPTDDLICSPLGLVPKKSPNEFRLIHNLSFPHGDSVNDGIPPEYSRVSYEDLDHCVRIIQSIGPNALIAKADLESAFRLLPIHKLDQRFLGFTWGGLFYIDKCLPMGLSQSCQHFEAFSTALQWTLRHHFQVSLMSHILDDFIFFGYPGSHQCSRSLSKFFILADDLKIPIKQSKTVYPSTTVELHGVEVDTSLMEMRLPPDKLVKAFGLLDGLKRRRSVTLRELQSALGFLNFAYKVIEHGRPFLQRLIDLTRHATSPSHHIRLNKETRFDIAAWLSFLRGYNGVSIFVEPSWTESNTVSLFSDASGLGFAAVFGSRYIQGSWPPLWSNYGIAIKELYPIALAVELCGSTLSNKRIMLHCDNQSVVYIINSQTAKCPLTMRLVRRITVASMSSNLVLRSAHIPGGLTIRSLICCLVSLIHRLV